MRALFGNRRLGGGRPAFRRRQLLCSVALRLGVGRFAQQIEDPRQLLVRTGITGSDGRAFVQFRRGLDQLLLLLQHDGELVVRLPEAVFERD